LITTIAFERHRPGMAALSVRAAVAIFTVNYQTKTKHMKRYKVIRIIGAVLLVLGAALIILRIMEGGKSVIHTIGAGGAPIGIGSALFGLSLRLENKKKASGHPSNTPK
jgi:hypothetical protein